MNSLTAVGFQVGGFDGAREGCFVGPVVGALVAAVDDPVLPSLQVRRCGYDVLKGEASKVG